jgi:hypothetical protein
VSTPTATPNLRASRKQLAAAKRPTPVKKAAPTKSPAAQKPAEKQATPKLKWTLLAERDEKGRAECTAAGGGREYAIDGSGDAWRAVYKQGRKETVLAEGTFGKCYNAVVAHNKAQA